MAIVVCKKCKVSFQNRPSENGIRIGSRKRAYCYECWPYQNKGYGRNTVTNVYEGGHKCELCGCCVGKYKKRFCPKCKNKYMNYLYRYKCMQYKGWKCIDCDKQSNKTTDFDEFDFHHCDTKEFDISRGKNKSWSKVQSELDKCVLLCANCHRKRHSVIIEEQIIQLVQKKCLTEEK